MLSAQIDNECRRGTTTNNVNAEGNALGVAARPLWNTHCPSESSTAAPGSPVSAPKELADKTASEGSEIAGTNTGEAVIGSRVPNAAPPSLSPSGSQFKCPVEVFLSRVLQFLGSPARHYSLRSHRARVRQAVLGLFAGGFNLNEVRDLSELKSRVEFLIGLNEVTGECGLRGAPLVGAACLVRAASATGRWADSPAPAAETAARALNDLATHLVRAAAVARRDRTACAAGTARGLSAAAADAWFSYAVTLCILFVQPASAAPPRSGVLLKEHVEGRRLPSSAEISGLEVAEKCLREAGKDIKAGKCSSEAAAMPAPRDKKNDATQQQPCATHQQPCGTQQQPAFVTEQRASVAQQHQQLAVIPPFVPQQQSTELPSFQRPASQWGDQAAVSGSHFPEGPFSAWRHEAHPAVPPRWGGRGPPPASAPPCLPLPEVVRDIIGSLDLFDDEDESQPQPIAGGSPPEGLSPRLPADVPPPNDSQELRPPLLTGHGSGGGGARAGGGRNGGGRDGGGRDGRGSARGRNGNDAGAAGFAAGTVGFAGGGCRSQPVKFPRPAAAAAAKTFVSPALTQMCHFESRRADRSKSTAGKFDFALLPAAARQSPRAEHLPPPVPRIEVRSTEPHRRPELKRKAGCRPEAVAEPQAVDDAAARAWLRSLASALQSRKPDEVKSAFDLMVTLHRPRPGPNPPSGREERDDRWLRAALAGSLDVFESLQRKSDEEGVCLAELLERCFTVGVVELFRLAGASGRAETLRHIAAGLSTHKLWDTLSAAAYGSCMHRSGATHDQVCRALRALESSTVDVAQALAITVRDNLDLRETAVVCAILRTGHTPDRSNSAQSKNDPLVYAFIQNILRCRAPGRDADALVAFLILPQDPPDLMHQVRMHTKLFETLADHLLRWKKDGLLLRLIERLETDPEWRRTVHPEPQTLGMMIKALGAAGRLEVCRFLFQLSLESSDAAPGADSAGEVAQGCMLDALVNNGRVGEAVELFERLKATSKLRPNTIMYTTLVKGFAQERQLDHALALYDEMRSSNVPLNTVTYNSLVDACARVGAMDQATVLLEHMLASRVEPDLITFSTVVKGYCVQGNIVRAMQLFDAMRERGIVPDGILYNSLLDGCVRANRLDMCERLWGQMCASAVAPSNFTLTILIKLFGRAGRLDRAFEAVRSIPVAYEFQVNAHVYTCLMSACIANREFETALDVFFCMLQDGLAADAKCCDTALLAAAKARNFPAALEIISFAFDVGERRAGRARSGPGPPRLARHGAAPPGLKMDPRNFRMLWTGMREERALQTADDLLRAVSRAHGGAAVARYFPQSRWPPAQTAPLSRRSSRAF